MSCALDILVLKSQTKDHPRLDTDLNKAITTKEIKQNKTNLVKQKIREDVVTGEIMRTTRTIALISKMSQNAHITKAVATSRQKSVFDYLHAYRTQHILVHVSFSSLFLRRGWRHRM